MEGLAMAVQQMHKHRLRNRHPHTEPHTQVHTPTPEFLAGDIILFASTGDIYSKVARWLMRGEHEGPTYAVHTAQFLDPHRVLEMDMVAKIETLGDMLNRRYRQGPFRMFPPLPPLRPLSDATPSNRFWWWVEQLSERVIDALNRRYWQGLWKRRGFEVWRCATLTVEQRRALTREALKYVNVRLGFVKFWAHLFDDLICKLLHKDVFLFRRIDPEDRHPVCSGVTASVYDKALHYGFGVDAECADPDQIYDWVSSHPDEWVRVFSMEECSQRLSTRPGSRRRAREPWGPRIGDLAPRGGYLHSN
jgi:hypothetical protein